MKITVIQQNIIWNDITANLRQLGKFIRNIPKSDICLFPEMFSTGFSLKPENIAEPENGITVKTMLKWAVEYDMAFTGSIMTTDGKGHFYNRMYFVRPDGIIEYYDKCNLFVYSGESDVYTPGEKGVIWNFRGTRIKPAVCYDIRFPLFLHNVDDYDLLLISAAFPVSRILAWDTLIRARAIENSCYVAASNRVGDDEFGHYCGHSAIINPYGETIGSCRSECQGVMTAEMDWNLITDLRKRSRF